MRLVAITPMVLMCACAAPATVQGVFSGEAFSLHAENPIGTENASGRDIVVSLAEVDAETLRTVSVELREIAELPLGKPVQAGPGGLEDRRPTLDVVAGKLRVETRPDGAELWSAQDPARAVSVDGWIMLEAHEGDVVAGSFEVDLDDGGFVTGSFVAAVQ